MSPRLHRALAAFDEGAALLRESPGIECLRRGRSSETWRVRAGHRDWVVRLAGGDEARLGLDRAAEARLIGIVAAAGFGPQVVSVRPDDGVLVTAYLPAPDLDAATARSPAFAGGLARRVRALHALPVDAGAEPLRLGALLHHYLELEAPGDAPVPRTVLARLVDRRLAEYVPLGPALCHHDLHRANIRWREPLQFIDWEYAAWGDPVLDLAGYASYEDLDAPARAALLAGYGALPGLDAGSLDRARLLFDVLRALWLDAAAAWDTVAPASRAALQARLAEPA